MIIVSHNVSYISNHCNKFALLHDAKLRIYDEFEEAYSDFRNKIGIADKQIKTEPKARLAVKTRKQLIQTTNSTAQHDERFLNLVLEAHMRSQDQNWDAAKAAYDAAFELYPFHGGYWAQWAHVVKEGGDFELAEIGYRTACALGQSVGEIEEFFDFTLKRQERFPPENPLVGVKSGATHEQAPSIPDLTLLARLVWGEEQVTREETITLVRSHIDLDSLFAALLSDERFSRFHAAWLNDAMGLDPSHLKKRFKSAQSNREAALWAVNATCVAEVASSEKEVLRIAQSLNQIQDALPRLIASGGFKHWPKTMAALKLRFRSSTRP